MTDGQYIALAIALGSVVIGGGLSQIASAISKFYDPRLFEEIKMHGLKMQRVRIEVDK